MTLRSPSGRGRGALVAALLLHGAALAEPAPARLGLRWQDPAGLAPLSPASLEARLSERVGHPVFDESARDRILTVTWLGTPTQCAVELELTRGSELEGTRRIESPSGDCRSLGPALLAVAALLIEAAQAPEPLPSPEPSPEPEPEPAPVAPPAPPVQHSERPEPFALLSAGASVSSGFAPRVELGPSVAALLTPWARTRVGIRAGVFLPQEHGNSPGMKLTHGHASLLLCAMPFGSELALGACGSAGLHLYRSVGVSLPFARDARTFAPMLGLAARAEWHIIGHLWWVADLGAELATSPLYFHYASAEGEEVTVFRQQRAAPMLFVGITSELP